MTYELTLSLEATTAQGVPVRRIVAVVKDDAGAVILSGDTTVCGLTEDQARVYGEDVFLVDLRTNDVRLANLVLPIDLRQPPDPPAEEPPAEPEPDPLGV